MLLSEQFSAVETGNYDLSIISNNDTINYNFIEAIG